MLEAAIQRQVASWIGSGRFSVTKLVEGNLTRLRAYSVMARAAQEGRSFRYMRSETKALGDSTGLKHTYGRGAMQDDYRELVKQTKARGLLADKPGDYVASPFEMGRAVPWQKRKFNYHIKAQGRDTVSGVITDLDEGVLSDSVWTLDDMAGMFGDRPSFWGLQGSWEIYDIHIDSIWARDDAFDQ